MADRGERNHTARSTHPYARPGRKSLMQRVTETVTGWIGLGGTTEDGTAQLTEPEPQQLLQQSIQSSYYGGDHYMQQMQQPPPPQQQRSAVGLPPPVAPPGLYPNLGRQPTTVVRASSQTRELWSPQPQPPKPKPATDLEEAMNRFKECVAPGTLTQADLTQIFEMLRPLLAPGVKISVTKPGLSPAKPLLNGAGTPSRFTTRPASETFVSATPKRAAAPSATPLKSAPRQTAQPQSGVKRTRDGLTPSAAKKAVQVYRELPEEEYVQEDQGEQEEEDEVPPQPQESASPPPKRSAMGVSRPVATSTQALISERAARAMANIERLNRLSKKPSYEVEPATSMADYAARRASQQKVTQQRTPFPTAKQISAHSIASSEEETSEDGDAIYTSKGSAGPMRTKRTKAAVETPFKKRKTVVEEEEEEEPAPKLFDERPAEVVQSIPVPEAKKKVAEPKTSKEEVSIFAVPSLPKKVEEEKKPEVAAKKEETPAPIFSGFTMPAPVEKKTEEKKAEPAPTGFSFGVAAAVVPDTKEEAKKEVPATFGFVMPAANTASSFSSSVFSSEKKEEPKSAASIFGGLAPATPAVVAPAFTGGFTLPAVSEKKAEATSGWKCPCCETDNSDKDLTCTVCMVNRPADKPKKEEKKEEPKKEEPKKEEPKVESSSIFGGAPKEAPAFPASQFSFIPATTPKKESGWKCSCCETVNAESDAACSGCWVPNPNPKKQEPKKEEPKKEETQPKADAAPASFVFGAAPAAPKTDAAKEPASSIFGAASGAPIFGAPATESVGASIFGAAPDAKKEEKKKEEAAPAAPAISTLFGTTTPPVPAPEAEKKPEPAPASFIFSAAPAAAPKEEEKKTVQPAPAPFIFGAAAPAPVPLAPAASSPTPISLTAAPAAAPAPAPTPAGIFMFGAAPAAPAAEPKKDAPLFPTSGFSFSAPAATEPKKDTPFSLLGAPAAAAPTSDGMEVSAAPAAPLFGGFSGFPAAAAAPAATPAAPATSAFGAFSSFGAGAAPAPSTGFTFAPGAPLPAPAAPAGGVFMFGGAPAAPAAPAPAAGFAFGAAPAAAPALGAPAAAPAPTGFGFGGAPAMGGVSAPAGQQLPAGSLTFAGIPSGGAVVRKGFLKGKRHK